MEKLETCKQCHKIKPYSEFNKCSIKKNGITGKCKLCNQHNSSLYRKTVLPSGYQREYLNTRRHNTKQKIVEYFNNQCFDCKITYPNYVYDLHHLNPKEKDFGIGKYQDRSWELILPELTKCVMLCSNCHRIRHGKLREIQVGPNKADMVEYKFN